MSTHVPALDTTVQKTNVWLEELASELDGNRETAYQALRAVLHAVRDRIPVDETAQFSAQLPMLVRGIFFEGWKPAATPKKLDTKIAFLNYVQEKMQPRNDMELERVVPVVFASVSHHLTDGEAQDIRHLLPKEVQQLWPEIPKAA